MKKDYCSAIQLENIVNKINKYSQLKKYNNEVILNSLNMNPVNINTGRDNKGKQQDPTINFE